MLYKKKIILNVLLLIMFLFTLSQSCLAQNSPKFGLSASCNVNVDCEPDWCNQRRSVCLILKQDSNGVFVRWGTEALITNEKRDGRPLLLTAFHILDNKDEREGLISDYEQGQIDSLMVVFNYQSDQCTPNTPVTEPDTNLFVIVGATLLAYNTVSDFADAQYSLKN